MLYYDFFKKIIVYLNCISQNIIVIIAVMLAQVCSNTAAKNNGPDAAALVAIAVFVTSSWMRIARMPHGPG